MYINDQFIAFQLEQNDKLNSSDLLFLNLILYFLVLTTIIVLDHLNSE